MEDNYIAVGNLPINRITSGGKNSVGFASWRSEKYF
jgi:hypothetical protein